MTQDAHPASGRGRFPVYLVTGAALLAGVVAGVYLLAANVLNSTRDTGPAIGLSMIPPPLSPSATAREEASDRSSRELADRCAEELAAGADLINVAQDGVDHWGAHIQARSDGLAGTITNEEMRAIWKETRLAGPDDVANFTEASDRYLTVAGSCQEGDGELPAECLSLASLVADSAASARSVIAAWDGHLANMRKFADGGMTADEAQHEWEEAWARAPADLEAHEAAVQRYQAAPQCELAGLA